MPLQIPLHSSSPRQSKVGGRGAQGSELGTSPLVTPKRTSFLPTGLSSPLHDADTGAEATARLLPAALTARGSSFLHSQRVRYLGGRHLVAVWVHGRQDVDAGGLQQLYDALVPAAEFLTQELGQLQQQLSAQHLVAMHVAHILDFWLHCKYKKHKWEETMKPVCLDPVAKPDWGSLTVPSWYSRTEKRHRDSYWVFSPQ